MNNNQDEKAQSMLVSMGFAADQAAAALRECGGNLEHAANLLLSGNAPAAAAAAAANTASAATSTPIMIHGALHQYNVDNGKSACTCIALTAAQLFLQQAAVGTTAVDATFLQNAVLQGVETYHAVMRWHDNTNNNNNNTNNGTTVVAAAPPPGEHLSAEEVLQTGTFPSLQLDAAGVVQGLLSPPHGPLSLHVLLSASQLPSTWTAVLIIKPPETVLCCLPPRNANNNNNNNKDAERPFLLIDSHPRAQQFGADGSYVRQHDTLATLIESSLQVLFPATELGPDVPEWMGAAYNSFDLYRLRLAS